MVVPFEDDIGCTPKIGNFVLEESSRERKDALYRRDEVCGESRVEKGEEKKDKCGNCG